VDLVFEGGGVKGIALVGAFSILEVRGYEPQNMAGTSAGAIVAALLRVLLASAGVVSGGSSEAYRSSGRPVSSESLLAAPCGPEMLTGWARTRRPFPCSPATPKVLSIQTSPIRGRCLGWP
jgi:hypothetical protein